MIALTLETQTGAIRSFNRFWTNHMGVLDAGLLDTRFSLTEARVLFELGRTAETDMLRLRHELRIDPGYLSRIVKRFESGGLVEASSSPADGRRRVLRLTATGRAAFEDLDARSTAQAASMQSGLSNGGRRRLATAMATIRELLDTPSGQGPVVIRPPRVGDFGWVVHRHGVIYAGVRLGRDLRGSRCVRCRRVRRTTGFCQGERLDRGGRW